MESMAEILESELKEAVAVKNEKSLHRYVVLLSENIVSRQKHSEEFGLLKSDIREILVFMRERFEVVDKRFEAVDRRFEAVDKRFEAVDKRFDDINQRFSMMFRFITIGFVILATMMSVFQFLG